MPAANDTPPLDDLLRDQAERWAAGDRVPAEFYVDRHPTLCDDPRLIDLVYNEIILRERAGETPRIGEFQRRFPQIAADLQIQWELDGELLTAPPSTQLRAPDAEPKRDVHPHRIGDFDITGVLGRGGMGVVYRAVQRSLNREVALKMLRTDAAAAPGQAARFRAEAEAVARLRHPHIVQIYEVGEHAGRPFLALEYVAGGSLDRATRRRPQEPRAAAAAVETLARAIHHAHQRGVIHRDLKPSNILVSSNSQVPSSKSEAGDLERGTGNLELKVTDFGLAKFLDADSGQTRTGQVLGTPAYMAPEQATGHGAEAGVYTDVYSLGAILYELLTGKPPFVGDNSFDLLRRVASEEPPAPRAVVPAIPRDLEVIALKCLRKEPERRYPSAEALADDLRRFLDGRPIEARAVGPVERGWRWCRRNRGLAAALILVVGLLVAVTAVSVQSARRARADANVLGNLNKSLLQANDEIGRSERRARHDLAVQELNAAIGIGRENDGAACFLGLARALSFVPDGDDDLADEIRIHLGAWQYEFPRPEDPLPERTDGYRAVVEAPDGKTFLAVHGDGTAQLWTTEPRRPVGAPIRAEGPPDQPPAVVYSPDSRRVWTVVGKQAVCWDARTGKDTNAVLAAPAEITALAVEAIWEVNGPRLERHYVLIGCADGSVRLWLSDGRKPVAEAKLSGRVLTLFVATAMQRVGIVAGNWIHVCTFPALKELKTGMGMQGTIRAATVTHDRSGLYLAVHGLPMGLGDQIVAGQLDAEGYRSGYVERRRATLLAAAPFPGILALDDAAGSVYVQRYSGGKFTPACSPLRQKGRSVAVQWAPSGDALWTCQASPNVVRRWQFDRERAYLPISLPPAETRMWYHVGHTGLCYAPGGVELLSWAPTDEPLKHFGPSARDYLGRQSVAEGPVRHVIPARDGTRFWTFHDSKVQCWDALMAPEPSKVIRFGAAIQQLFLRPDGREWLTARRVQLPIPGVLVQRWSVDRATEAGRPVLLFPLDVVLGYSADGRFILVNRDHRLRRWDLATGAEDPPPFAAEVGPIGEVWTFDGAMYAESRDAEHLTLWNLWTGECVGRIPVPIGAVKPSPDGRYLLSAEALCKVIWDTSRGSSIGRVCPSQCDVRACEFSPDGGFLAIPGVFTDPAMRLVLTASARTVGPQFTFGGRNFGGMATRLAWHPQSRKVAASDGREFIQEWTVPTKVVGSLARIESWARVLTGARLDANGNVVGLTDAEWRRAGEELQEAGGPPAN
jgi:eukaryotic-like serine/threonine-protein kinase